MREQKIVYVPQRGFLGNDTLVYKVQDNFTQVDMKDYRHIDYGLATVFIVKHPPQIISTPQSLEVCEEGSLPVKRYASCNALPIEIKGIFSYGSYGFVCILPC